MSGGDEDRKPNTGGDHINLKVKGQDGNEVFFRIKRSTQLKKLMNAYCDRQSVEINSIAFLFDGRRLRAEQTPDELEMEEGDEIDAMLHQTGGGGGDVPTTGDQGAHITLIVKVLQEATATIQDLVERLKHLELHEKINHVPTTIQDGSEVYFKIKRNTRLKKLMKAYCDRKSVELNSIAFMFDGRLLQGKQTPDEDGGQFFFRIKRSAQLKKLMNFYCDRQSVDIHLIAFLFNGCRLRGEQTPDEWEMGDGDEIDAMLYQIGGGKGGTSS